MFNNIITKESPKKSLNKKISSIIDRVNNKKKYGLIMNNEKEDYIENKVEYRKTENMKEDFIGCKLKRSMTRILTNKIQLEASKLEKEDFKKEL